MGSTSLVRSTFFEVGKAGISFKITKSRIAIEGAPVSSVEWQLVRDGKVLLVDMSAWTEDEMNDEFLIRCFKKLDTGFRFFVLGEEDDGSES